MEIVNNIVFTKSTSSGRIKCCKIVKVLKFVGNLKKKKTTIVDKLLKERKDVVNVKNDEYCYNTVKKNILFLMKFLIVRFRTISKL